MTTVVTGKRQLTVPLDIARKLNIETGTAIEWEPGKDGASMLLRIKPSRRQLLDRVQAIGRKYRDRGGDSARILERLRDEDDAERTAELDALARGPRGRARRDSVTR